MEQPRHASEDLHAEDEWAKQVLAMWNLILQHYVLAGWDIIVLLHRIRLGHQSNKTPTKTCVTCCCTKGSSVYITNVYIYEYIHIYIHMHVNMLEFMSVSHSSSCTPYLSQALTSANHAKLGSMAVACWWWGACRTHWWGACKPQWMGVYPRLLVLGDGHYLAHWDPYWRLLVGWQLLVLEQAQRSLGCCSAWVI